MKKVIPFSTGTEAEIWMFRNCDKCTTSRNCSAKKNIELGFITSEITIKSAEFIGIATKFIDSDYINLNIECKNKDNRKIKNYKKNKVDILPSLF